VKRADQAAATRQRLIDAAARLFAQGGFTASSVAAIGEAAGVSRGLVNFHFSTKENLLRAVIEQLVAELEQQMFPPDPPADPLAALAVLVEAHRRFLSERPDRTRPWWEQALADRQINTTLDHNAVVTFTIGALRGIALEWLLAPEAVDLEAAYGHLFRSLEAGLTS
jgi:AcrR family transcriptional regulator